MSCSPEVLKDVWLFSLLDKEELDVLASQVELCKFAPRQRIYKQGDPSNRAFVMLSGSVQVSTIDEDNQIVLLDEPIKGDLFGFASMLAQTPHQTDATAIQESLCIELDLNDITVLIRSKPDAGLDLMKVMGKQFHATERLISQRTERNPNEVFEESQSIGERIADVVASFGGSWNFIIIFGLVLLGYTLINVELKGNAWDPYPFILLNLFLSMLAAIQATVIMMSQNRQDKKDRLRNELDFEINRRAHTEIQGLARRINQLYDKLDDVEEILRNKR